MQNEIKNFPGNPISLAIKLIGVGKRGSRHLSQEIIELVKQEVMSIRKIDTQYAIQLGAFLSVLGIKENDENEEKFFDELLSYFSKKTDLGFSREEQSDYHFEILTNYLFPNIEAKLKSSMASVFFGNEIKESEFGQISRLLFAPVVKESEVEVYAARAFVTSIIRYRYTAKKEYFGLYRSFIKEPNQRNKVISDLKIQLGTWAERYRAAAMGSKDDIDAIAGYHKTFAELLRINGDIIALDPDAELPDHDMPRVYVDFWL